MKHAVSLLSIVSVIALIIVGQSQSPDASQGAIELIERGTLGSHRPAGDMPSEGVETPSTTANNQLESGSSPAFGYVGTDELDDDQQAASASEYRVASSGAQSINDWVEEVAANNTRAEKLYENARGEKPNSITADAETASVARIMHVEISGNETITTVGGVVTRSVNTNYVAVAEQATANANAASNHSEPQAGNQLVAGNEMPADDVLDEVSYSADGEQEKYTLPCPDSLYGGGNAYAISMLKKRGCPKPAFYHGVW